MHIEKLLPDTSIIIEGIISRRIAKKELTVGKILIHEAVLAELEHQANENKSVGWFGIEEIDRIRKNKIEYVGARPKFSEIKYASLGEIDALIGGYAFENDCVLMTSDRVQARVGEVKGIKVVYVEADSGKKKIKLEDYFDNTTMSVHLKENCIPYAKKGKPGRWDFVAVKKRKITQGEIQDISREIIEECKIRRDGFIEIERRGSTIVQLGKYRIVITRPPLSDGWEVTAVRPVKMLKLEDYKLSEKLTKRIGVQAEGILIAGSPGMGKSTFAQALAEYYSSQNKIVKTVEAPRDLVLGDEITQYAISHGDSQEIRDILLLSRPDYTLFDEMRNTNDFELFADMRLAGVGMVGVVHATSPIDAIQRFIGRVEMGVIPQIIDTVVFIKDGGVAKVLNLAMTVKVPSGMTEADLARPVVVVFDFESGKLEYEIYSYGEQTVVVPVREESKKPLHSLAEETIRRVFQNFDPDADVEITTDDKCIVRLAEGVIAKVIGKGGKTINQLEDKLGLHIDVQEKTVSEKKEGIKREVKYDYKIKSNMVVFFLAPSLTNKDIDIYVNDDYLLTAKTGKSGMIRIKKGNKIGSILVDALNSGEKITLLV